MKKIIYTVLASLIFTACSSDSLDERTGGNNLIDGKKYPVSFSIQPFEVETNPKLRAGDKKQNPYLQYIIYFANRDIRSITAPPINNFSIENWVTSNIISLGEDEDVSSIKIETKLTKGDYYILVLNGKDPLDAKNDTEIKGYGFIPKSFGTPWSNYKPEIFYEEIYKGYGIGAKESIIPGKDGKNYSISDNTNIYSGYIPFTVAEGGGIVSTPIKLTPIWSNISVKVKDAATCALPQGTTHVALSHKGRGISYNFYTHRSSYKLDRTAGIPEDEKKVPVFTTLTVEEFRNKGMFSTITTGNVADEVELDIVFLDSEENLYNPLGVKSIYKGSTQVAKNYTISGSLDQEDGSLFNLSLKGLEDVEHGLDLQ